MRICAVVLCALLAACGPSRINAVKTEADSYSLDSFSAVREFRLKDGTRCVTYGHGIDCEWACKK